MPLDWPFYAVRIWILCRGIKNQLLCDEVFEFTACESYVCEPHEIGLLCRKTREMATWRPSLGVEIVKNRQETNNFSFFHKITLLIFPTIPILTNFVLDKLLFRFRLLLRLFFSILAFVVLLVVTLGVIIALNYLQRKIKDQKNGFKDLAQHVSLFKGF